MRVQTAWNINILNTLMFVYIGCMCVETDKKAALRWNLTFLSMYNLLESAFSKQTAVQIQTDWKGRNITETRCLCAYVTSAARPHCHCPHVILFQHENTLKQSRKLSVVDDHKNVCTIIKGNEQSVMYKVILWLCYNGSTNRVESFFTQTWVLLF